MSVYKWDPKSHQRYQHIEIEMDAWKVDTEIILGTKIQQSWVCAFLGSWPLICTNGATLAAIHTFTQSIRSFHFINVSFLKILGKMFVKISANKCGLFSLMDQTSWVGRVMTPAWNVAVRISAVFNEGSLKRFWLLKKWKPCWCYCFFVTNFLVSK